MISKCEYCGKPLNKLETIIAYDGLLYCSEECTKSDIKDHLEIDLVVDGMYAAKSEEVSTDILSDEYLERDEMLAIFKKLAMCQGSWSSFVAHLEEHPDIDTLWEHLESKKFTDEVDLIMYMEGGI